MRGGATLSWRNFQAQPVPAGSGDVGPFCISPTLITLLSALCRNKLTKLSGNKGEGKKYSKQIQGLLQVSNFPQHQHGSGHRLDVDDCILDRQLGKTVH